MIKHRGGKKDKACSLTHLRLPTCICPLVWRSPTGCLFRGRSAAEVWDTESLLKQEQIAGQPWWTWSFPTTFLKDVSTICPIQGRLPIWRMATLWPTEHPSLSHLVNKHIVVCTFFLWRKFQIHMRPSASFSLYRHLVIATKDVKRITDPRNMVWPDLRASLAETPRRNSKIHQLFDECFRSKAVRDQHAVIGLGQWSDLRGIWEVSEKGRKIDIKSQTNTVSNNFLGCPVLF